MPRRGKRIRLATGIFRDQTGIAVILPCLNAKGEPSQEEHRYPPHAELAKLKAWREDQVKKRKDRKAAGRAQAGTFAADAVTYLEAVTALPRYQQRCVDIGYWVDLFGHRRRDSIQSHEIRAVRDRWLTVGPKQVQQRPAPGQKAVWTKIAAPLAPQSVALRMRALENLWTVLDGKKADNPVREVPEPDQGTLKPRGLPPQMVDRLLAALPPGEPMSARLRIMAHAGLAQSELARVRPEDIDLAGRVVWVPGRKKGRGAQGGIVPLSLDAVRAFRALLTLDACGPFDTSNMWRFFQRHTRALGIRHVRPYDLRHSLLSGIYAASGDEGAVKTIARHASVVTTRRYIEAAVNPRAAAAMAQFTASRRAPTPCHVDVPAFAREKALSGASRRGVTRRKSQ